MHFDMLIHEIAKYAIEKGEAWRIGEGCAIMDAYEAALSARASDAAAGEPEFKNMAEWKAHYRPNDFVLGDNTRHIATEVTAESVARAMRLDEAITHPAGEPKASQVTDELIEQLSLKHIAPNAEKFKEAFGLNIPYQQTEQFRRVKAFAVELLEIQERKS